MRTLVFSIVGLTLLGCDAGRPPSSPPAPPTAPNTSAAQPADRTNTAVNVRDRDSSAKTPIDQNENQADINTTANIRKRVVEKKLSVEATNVKIITQDGKVVLRGPVATVEEKETIEEIAKDVAGADKVDSQLEVSGK